MKEYHHLEHWGRVIKEMRLKRGLTAKQAGELVGKHATKVHLHEASAHLSTRLIMLYSKAYNFDFVLTILDHNHHNKPAPESTSEDSSQT